MFAQKFKMAAAAILNYYFILLFCNAGPPTKPVCGPRLALQILHCSSLYISRYRDLKSSQIWLKMPIQAQKIMFLGSLLFIIDTPKRHFLAQKHAFWALIGRDRSYGVIWTRREVYKKERTRSKLKFAIFADPLPVVPHQPNFARGVVSQILFLVLSFKKIGWKMWEQWGSNFFAFLLTWHIAYTTA